MPLFLVLFLCFLIISLFCFVFLIISLFLYFFVSLLVPFFCLSVGLILRFAKNGNVSFLCFFSHFLCLLSFLRFLISMFLCLFPFFVCLSYHLFRKKSLFPLFLLLFSLLFIISLFPFFFVYSPFCLSVLPFVSRRKKARADVGSRKTAEPPSFPPFSQDADEDDGAGHKGGGIKPL